VTAAAAAEAAFNRLIDAGNKFAKIIGA